MVQSEISPNDPNPRHRTDAGGAEMAYVDVGQGEPIVFIHGNPTSSYLWRNVIPHLQEVSRCLAPDLVGMGDSGPAPNGSYRFADHSHFLDIWFDNVLPDGTVTLVMHDWGSALGFHWARRNPERIKGLVYMEAIVRPVAWDEFPDAARPVFQGFRSDAGEEMVLENNIFVERVLPGSVLRDLTDYEMAVYRRPFMEKGETRRPTLTWPREIPIDGEPADVATVVNQYAEWLSASPVPKLFINAEPGAILAGPQREFCRAWPNQTEFTVSGVHFIQEDSPHEIGEAIAHWYGSI